MKRVLVLGGGFGGLATAHTYKKLRPSDEVILVDRNPHFIVGFRKTWALLGMSPLAAGQGRLADLEWFGIQYIQGNVTAIEPEARAAVVDGQRIEADALVVALGAQLAGDKVPGFLEHGYDLYDPTQIPHIADTLDSFPGGEVVVGVMGLPYKCPPAPYEIALLVNEYFQERGVDANVTVFSPQPSSLPVLGTAGCNVIEGRLAQQGIAFLPNKKVTSVEAGEVLFENGRKKYDLLLGVSPHRCPDVVVASGLAGGAPWVRVDPQTLQTSFEGVYAIGDVTVIHMANGKPLPKAGIFAEGEGRVVAERLAAIFDGREPEATFDGKGGCFLEVGRGQAMMVEGEFLAEPMPQVRLQDADESYLEQKWQFERQRLEAWFPQPA